MPDYKDLSKQLLAKAKVDGMAGCAVSGVIRDGNKILILRRNPDDTSPGMYEIPGGGVEKGETLETALIREVWEETGLRVTSVDSYMSYFEFDGHIGRVREFDFFVTVEKGEVKMTEHDDYVWVSREKLYDYPMTKEMRHVLEQAFDMK